MIIKPHELQLAVSALQSGEVVAIPTETVYGLAADITQEKAVRTIFELKGRPTNHPLIIHIGCFEELSLYALDMPDYVEILAEAFWPGPLSLVLKKSPLVSELVTGGQETVAIRMPNHPLTLSLIRQVGHPLAAPSANRFGKISPTQVEHVIEEFGTKIKILAGEACQVGIESTIIDATDPEYCTILRPGIISIAAIQAALGSRGKVYAKSEKEIRVPGALKSHYAPSKPTFLFEDKSGFEKLAKRYPNSLSLLYISACFQGNFGFQMASTPDLYAKQLYNVLRMADNSSKQAIAIEMPENKIEWVAIRDRLEKCSAEK